MTDVTREEDHAPGIAPKGRVQGQGQCRYCKQYMLVWAPEGADQKMLNDIAEQSCQCEEGEEFRKQEYEKNHVQKKIEQYFPDESDMKDLVDGCADAVMSFVAKKITIVTNDNKNNKVTFSITRKKGITEIKKVTQEEELL
ncbi:MAG: hypothetical protein IJU77_11490 [Butyrivibrio sp.]|nr:hypothetical protein [Butyrivibrio sp.]